MRLQAAPKRASPNGPIPTFLVDLPAQGPSPSVLRKRSAGARSRISLARSVPQSRVVLVAVVVVNIIVVIVVGVVVVVVVVLDPRSLAQSVRGHNA